MVLGCPAVVWRVLFWAAAGLLLCPSCMYGMSLTYRAKRWHHSLREPHAAPLPRDKGLQREVHGNEGASKARDCQWLNGTQAQVCSPWWVGGARDPQTILPRFKNSFSRNSAGKTNFF